MDKRMMKKLKDKRIIKYLAYLAVVSMILTSGTMAKFTADETATGTASIALFASGTSYETDLAVGGNIFPGSSREISFTVENYNEDGEESDIAIQYDIEVLTTNNLPLEFNLSGTGASGGEVDRLVGAFSKTALTASGGILPVGAEERKTHSYTLTIEWPETETDDRYSDEIDMITIKVTTAQADPTQ